MKKVCLKISQNSPERTCARVSFLIKLYKACYVIKKEALAQVVSCEFRKAFKNISLTKHHRATASNIMH